MTPQTFIFIGRGGSGKGTQVALLLNYLKKIDSKRKVLDLETGNEFRKLLGGKGYSVKLMNEIYAKGGLMPSFLPIWVWSDFLIKNLEGDEHLVIDGVARRFGEVDVLDSAFQFYKRGKPTIVYVNISREVAFERLMSRKRSDDNESEINNRLDWFDEEVLKSVDFYKKSPHYHFLDINGEQTIEKVHEEIVSKIGANL